MATMISARRIATVSAMMSDSGCSCSFCAVNSPELECCECGSRHCLDADGCRDTTLDGIGWFSWWEDEE